MSANEPRRSAVEQFRPRKSEAEEELEPLEKWDRPYRETWRSARPRSREDIMLDVRFNGGNRQAFGYSFLGSILYDGDMITLLFSDVGVRIKGRGLDRIYDALVQHRVPFIQEGSGAEEGMKSEDEPHIESIEVINERTEEDDR